MSHGNDRSMLRAMQRRIPPNVGYISATATTTQPDTTRTKQTNTTIEFWESNSILWNKLEVTTAVTFSLA